MRLVYAMVGTARILALALFVPSLAIAVEPLESDFFLDTIGSSAAAVNVVSDYGANGADGQDDSTALQAAIDAMTLLPSGGTVYVPSGEFHFGEIELKSNVHLQIDSGVTIIPTESPGNYSVFRMGADRGVAELDVVENTSIRGLGGRFTVDLTGVSNTDVSVVAAKNVDNFQISGIDVLDKRTKFSSMRFTLAEHNGEYASPRNGVVKDLSTQDAHYGYGMVQVQVGTNLLFKNLDGKGGATLRLESGATQTTLARDVIMDNIWGRDISSTEGRSAVMLSPHAKDNGHVDIERVTAVNSGFAVDVAKGFPDQDYPQFAPGTFADTSRISDIHAVYGEDAELKSKHFRYIPCPVRDGISDSPIYDGNIFEGPSVSPVLYTADGNGIGEYNVEITDVTQSGFVYQPRAILTEADAALDCPPQTGLQGDFNADGVVDAADYTHWRDHQGGGGPEGDGTGPGLDGVPDSQVDIYDYHLWKVNYNAQSASSGTAIPEPNAVIELLCSLAIAAVFAAARR